MNNPIEQTEEYYDARWLKTIDLLPTGGDYRLDLRSRAWRIIADYIGENKRVFEFATGVSHLPEYLEGNRCTVKGCDFSQVAVDYNKGYGEFRKTDKIYGSGYDFITACQFIEHIEKPAEWIEDALNFAPVVICSIPNNFRQVGDHYLMQWKNWDEFNRLFEAFDVERIDTPDMYNGIHTAWNHPIFIFKRKGKNKMHVSDILKLNEVKNVKTPKKSKDKKVDKKAISSTTKKKDKKEDKIKTDYHKN